VRLTGVLDHLYCLAAIAQLRNDYLIVELVHQRPVITLHDEDWTSYSIELGARNLLMFGRVVAFGVFQNRRDILSCKPRTCLREFNALDDAGKEPSSRFF
jgi:hypothetical protein